MSIKWLVYIVSGIVLILFVVPTLVSMPDTSEVILGLIICLAFGVISWQFWIRRTILTLRRKLKDEE